MFQILLKTFIILYLILNIFKFGPKNEAVAPRVSPWQGASAGEEADSRIHRQRWRWELNPTPTRLGKERERTEEDFQWDFESEFNRKLGILYMVSMGF